MSISIRYGKTVLLALASCDAGTWSCTACVLELWFNNYRVAILSTPTRDDVKKIITRSRLDDPDPAVCILDVSSAELLDDDAIDKMSVLSQMVVDLRTLRHRLND